MRRHAGVTLVELMIVVALVGISTGVVSNAVQQERLDGLGVLQRARAAELLDYHAGRLATGAAPSPEVAARLAADLPRSTVEEKRAGELVTVTVTWRSPRGFTESSSLAVFAKGGR